MWILVEAYRCKTNQKFIKFSSILPAWKVANLSTQFAKFIKATALSGNGHQFILREPRYVVMIVAVISFWLRLLWIAAGQMIKILTQPQPYYSEDVSLHALSQIQTSACSSVSLQSLFFCNRALGLVARYLFYFFCMYHCLRDTVVQILSADCQMALYLRVILWNCLT